MTARWIVPFAITIVIWSCECARLSGQSTAAPPPNSVTSDESDKLGALLDRLGLDELELFRLDRKFEGSNDREQKKKIARQLVQLYSQQLLQQASELAQKGSGGGTEIQASRDRLSQLTAEFQELNQPPVRVAVIFADYMSAESQFNVWRSDLKNADARNVASSSFDSIIRRIESLKGQLESELGKLTEGATSDIDRDEALLRQEAKLEGLISQLQYIGGWCFYYRGVCHHNAELSQGFYSRADEEFRKLLNVGADQNLAETEVDWFDLDSVWVSRTVLGLALAEQALTRPDGAQGCFSILSESRVPRSIRDRLPIWQFYSFLYPQKFEVLRRVIQKQSSQRPFGNQDTTYWFTVGASAPQIAQSGDRDLAAIVAKIAAIQLAKLNKFQLIERLITEEKISLDDFESGFFENWIRANRWFNLADQKQNVTLYGQAEKALREALNQSNAVDPVDAARCRYLLAWCQFRLQNYSAAANNYRRSAVVLRSVDPAISAGAMWLRYQALMKTRQRQQSILLALDELERMHPGSRYSQKAEFERMRIKASNGDQNSIDALHAVATTDPNYAAVQLELCRLDHVGWTRTLASDDTSARNASAKKLRDSVRTILADKDITDPSILVQAMLFDIDRCIRGIPQKLEQADRYLNRSSRWADKLEPSHAALSELQFQKFQVAKLQEQHDAAAAIAELVVEDANISYKQAALVYLAQVSDKQVVESSGAQKDAAIQNAIARYGQLVESLGSSINDLRNSQNSRVALARMADLEMQAKMPEQADKHYQDLLTVAPNNQIYLQQSGRIKVARSDFDNALLIWRKIGKGVPVGGEDWIEAKYYVVLSLKNTGSDSARPVLDQTLKLCPSLPDHWKQKFKQLSDSINR